MLLCIDIGNTNTVLATFEGDKLVHSWRTKTDARSTAERMIGEARSKVPLSSTGPHEHEIEHGSSLGHRQKPASVTDRGRLGPAHPWRAYRPERRARL